MLLLIDGNNLLHRSIHATHKWSGLAGQYSAFAGTFTLLRSVRATLLEFPHITRVITVWDGDLSARRLKLLPTYKDRDRDPTRRREIFSEQSSAQHALSALGIPSYHASNYEADDVLAHLAREMSGPVLIMSDDRDMLQCVSDRVHIWRPIAEKRQAGIGYITPEIFPVKIAPFSPDRWIYYRALTGDTGDKIPGVYGIGEKTALKIVQGMDRADELQFAWSWTQFPTCYNGNNVATALRNVKLMDLRLEDMSHLLIPHTMIPLGHPPLHSIVEQLFDKWSFKSLLKDLPRWLDPFERLSRPRKTKTPVKK